MKFDLSASNITIKNPPRRNMELLAGRLKAERVRLGYRLIDLSERSGVKFSTLRKFEKTGGITMEGFFLLASALGRINEIDQLFRPPEIHNLEELDRPQRVRGKRGGPT